MLEFSAKTEAGTAIDVYDHYISLDSDSENTCDVAVDQKDWQYGDEAYLNISIDDNFSGASTTAYSSVIQTSNMYGDDSVEFTVVAGTLPSGVILKPNGELYGVPQAAGTWTFTVRATFTDLGNAYDEREFTLTIQDNTNSNVWDATDEGYELIEFIGEWIKDNQVSDEYDYDTILKDNYETDVFWTEGEFNY